MLHHVIGLCAVMASCAGHYSTANATVAAPKVGSAVSFQSLQGYVGPSQVAFLARGGKDTTYFVRVDPHGDVSYQAGIIGSSFLLKSKESYKLLTAGEQPDAWRATAASVNARIDNHPLLRNLELFSSALSRERNVGGPCLPPGYYDQVHPHHVPPTEPTEPPFVAMIWSDHHSAALGCDARSVQMQDAARSLLAELGLT